MFPVYACVSSLEGRDLCTRLHTYTHKHTHFPDKTAGSVYTTSEKSSILKNFTVVAKYVYLYSYHLATLPFSWRFSFDKLSKCDKLC